MLDSRGKSRSTMRVCSHRFPKAAMHYEIRPSARRGPFLQASVSSLPRLRGFCEKKAHIRTSRLPSFVSISPCLRYSLFSPRSSASFSWPCNLSFAVSGDNGIFARYLVRPVTLSSSVSPLAELLWCMVQRHSHRCFKATLGECSIPTLYRIRTSSSTLTGLRSRSTATSAYVVVLLLRPIYDTDCIGRLKFL